MKALDISGENLEELLAYDDLFLDYFNAFLSLPVFPQAIAYNRLTGAFEEIEGPSRSIAGSALSTERTLSYGATDEEREKMLEWARQERLPLFFSTQLFREFKLCKLLLRPLDDRNSASRGSSRQIRGYSRQTESYVSSLSNSADNSANEAGLDEDMDFVWMELHHSALYRYPRPGSMAYSLPGIINLDNEMDQPGQHKSSHRASQSGGPPTPPDNHKSINSNETKSDDSSSTKKKRNSKDRPRFIADDSRENTQVSFDLNAEQKDKESNKASRDMRDAPISSAEKAFQRHARAISAPTNFQDYMRLAPYSLYDAMYGEDEPEPNGQVYVTFGDDVISDAQTETDTKIMEGKMNMSLQQMKEQYMGSSKDMASFKKFLIDTAGWPLFNFWVDCEYFKDAMEDFDEIKKMDARNQLFRDIQDKYKMNLTRDAQDQIGKSSSNVGLSHTIFIRTQYDVLRRLRAYWVHRFLVHHFSDIKRSIGVAHSSNEISTLMSSRDANQSLPFFPSISLVNSMSVIPDMNMQSILRSVSWDVVSSGGRRLDDRVTSARTRWQPVVCTPARTTKARFALALSTDKDAGGPFLKYLTKKDDKLLLSCLLFWQDVTEYGAAEDRAADRLLRLRHAWAIFNKYLSKNSISRVEISEQDCERIQGALISSKDFIEASVFYHAKYTAVEKLETAWIRHLKEDLKTFLDSRVIARGDIPPSTAEVIEITITNTDIVINRPRPWVRSSSTPERHPGSSGTERSRRLRTALSTAESIDVERIAEHKRLEKERRKEMEKERRKAVRNARKRQRDAKLNKNRPDHNGDEDYDDLDSVKGTSKDKVPTFKAMLGNKQIMSMFKKHLQEGENREPVNMVNLFIDITAYNAVGSSPAVKQKKDMQATYIQKTYLDLGGRKHTTLTDKINARLSVEKDRPRSATLKEIHNHIIPKIEETFQEFITYQAEEIGVEPKVLATMSQSELAMRFESEATLLSNWNKKGTKTKEDKTLKDLLMPGVTVSIKEGAKSASPVVTKNYSKPQPPKKLPMQTRQFFPEAPPQTFRIFPTERGDGSEQPRAPSIMPYMRRRGKKVTGRAAPTKDDREKFYQALNQSAMGHLTMPLLYFYKYLVKYGETEGFPQLDKDLFFYIEVQKFKECNHVYADEEMVKRKVQSVVDCFLDSVTSPPLQIDVPAEIHQKTLRTAQKYLNGKEAITSTMFDEAHYLAFKELLPFWAGFRKHYSPPKDPNKKPLTKFQKLLQKRLETMDHYQIPRGEFFIPSIPHGSVPAFTFSLADGVKWRSEDDAAPSKDGVSESGELTKGRSLGLAVNVPDGMRRRRQSPADTASTVSRDLPSGRQSMMSRA